MTDITELAQSLKAAADREMICRDGAETSEIWERTVTPENILALVEALEYYKSREERVTSLVRDNSKSWDELYRQVEAKGKRNVELVEALESEKRICATWRKTAEANSEKLEKAQQQTTESENRVRKQNRHICELFDDNTALRQRIAELESRAVKLIDCDFGAVQHMSGGSTDYCNGFVDGTQNAIRSISAAGIKVEAE